MAKNPFMEISNNHDFLVTSRYIKDMPDRIKAAMRMFAYVMANDLLRLLKTKIPKQDHFAELSSGLKVSEVVFSGGFAFACHIDDKYRKIKKIDVAKTVIYVRARKLLNRASQGVLLLENMGPWTPDTIPYWPNMREALIIQRRVSKREADNISKRQKSQKSKVDAALLKVGQRRGDGARDLRPGRSGKAIPDLAMLGLTMEFGGPGQRPIAAWRTSLQEIMSIGVKTAIRRTQEMERALTDPDYNGWKKWPRSIGKISEAKAIEMSEFQKRLGY